MKINNIIVHHTGGTDANPLQDSSNYTLAQCNIDHKRRFNMLSSLGSYVGYHYFIDKAGVITQTRVDTEEGAHCIGYNNHPGSNPTTFSIGVCLAGNFDATLPTAAQVATLKKFLEQKVAQYGIQTKNIFPHRRHEHKTCYGTKLADDWAAKLISAPAAPAFSRVSIGDTGPEVQKIQSFLANKGYVLSTLAPGVYDPAMAQAVLHFQIKNSVADLGELCIIRGERVGPKTLAAIIRMA